MDGKTNASVNNVFAGFRWVSIPGYIIDYNNTYTASDLHSFSTSEQLRAYSLSSNDQQYYNRNAGVCKAGYSAIYTSSLTYYPRSLSYDSIKSIIEKGMSNFSSNLKGDWNGVERIKVYARYMDIADNTNAGYFTDSTRIYPETDQPSTYFIYNLNTKEVEYHNFMTSFNIYCNLTSQKLVRPALALYDIEIA